MVVAWLLFGCCLVVVINLASQFCMVIGVGNGGWCFFLGGDVLAGAGQKTNEKNKQIMTMLELIILFSNRAAAAGVEGG